MLDPLPASIDGPSKPWDSGNATEWAASPHVNLRHSVQSRRVCVVRVASTGFVTASLITICSHQEANNEADWRDELCSSTAQRTHRSGTCSVKLLASLLMHHHVNSPGFSGFARSASLPVDHIQPLPTCTLSPLLLSGMDTVRCLCSSPDMKIRGSRPAD